MKEEDIRPNEIFKEYLRLCELDSLAFFNDVKLEEIKCPACGETGEASIIKNNFTYDECQSCFTLYVNPRPISKAFENFYKNSDSSKYWATTFYKTTENSRRKQLWLPKAKKIDDLLSENNLDNYSLVDIGGGYGTFVEEFQKICSIESIIIEPTSHLAEICRKKGIKVIEKFLENVEKKDLPNNNILFTSYELFEHLHSPIRFLSSLYELMNIGDYFYFTTLSGIGVDIQSLWDDSKSISPPQHLNFFNPNSIKIILEKNNFEIVKINTPGKLDIDILNNNFDNLKDRFWKTFISTASDDKKNAMQIFLSSIGYSSHMEVVCKKIN